MTGADWIVLVVVLPLAAGIAGGLVRKSEAYGRTVVTVLLGLTGVVGAYFLARLPETGGLRSVIGAWPAPYGIEIVFDALSGTLITAGSFVAAICMLAARGEGGDRFELGWLPTLMGMLLLGVNFSFLTGDLFNLFVAFEIMLMASYGLVVRNASGKGLTHAHKYVVLNLFGSSVFVLAAGLLYGVTGTLNLASLAEYARAYAESGEALPVGFSAAGVMLLFVFLLKSAAFPLWFWLPDTYHLLPTSVAAVFAALLSKVGVYAVVRILPPVFGREGAGVPLETILVPVAGATMLLAAVCALGVSNYRRVLAFLLVTHIGYMLYAVVLGSAGATGAAVFMIAQEMFVIAGLYLSAVTLRRIAGSDDLRAVGGIARTHPFFGWCVFGLLVGAAGLPPAAGFVAKAWLLREGAASGGWVLWGVMLVAAALVVLTVGRVWCALFWNLQGHARPSGAGSEPAPWLKSGVVLCVIGLVVCTVGAPVLYELASRAGAENTVWGMLP